MGAFTFLLIIVIILAIIGLGWRVFASGLLTGIDRVLKIGSPAVKDWTNQAKEYVHNAGSLVIQAR
jgi:hypothetical protein